ncbi:MAG: copper resistance protein CopC [Gaiellaceae bacterium]
MKRALVVGVVAASALALPAAAWAHAALLKTFPPASAEVDTPPAELRLVYDEAVEPRFAVVSVTDAAAHQQIDGPLHPSASNPYELDAPLTRSAEGWYLVFWRVISADGHPARGAFLYRVGPNPGPPPQFVIPSLSETAVTPGLVALRWLTFLSAMAAVGLFVLRTAIARPVVARVSGTSLRAVSLTFGASVAVGLVVTPIYVLLATARFALRSFWSFGALVPLMDVSAFGRAYLRFELLLALFAVAAAAAIWLDRPHRAQRSVAGLLSLWGALLAAGALLLVPGAAGHAAQTSPRALALAFDWLHLAAGTLWIGGLVGLLVLWSSLPAVRRTAGLVVCVPRFSNAALVSVVVLLGSGIGAAVLHLPTLATLWQTGYGKTIVVKASLLFAAILLAAVNLLRTKPGLARNETSAGAAVLLRRLVAGEVVLVAAAIVAAAVLSSYPPPPKTLASIGAPAATAGPGPVTEVVQRNGYRVDVRVSPNKVAVPDEYTVRLTRNGAPVRGATVVATFTMLDMEMPTQAYRLAERAPGVYEHTSEALVMVGRWGLTFQVQPAGAQPFDVVVVDHAAG